MSDFTQPAGQSTVRWEGHVGMVQQADKRFVEFYRGAVPNGVRSDHEGRPIFDPVDMVKIIHPGERDIHMLRVQEHHKHEFPHQWAAYQAGFTEEAQSGTPIDTLYPNEPGMVKQFHQLHIYTAEQMAGLTEQGIMRLGMGGRQHVERAKKFLEHAERMSGASTLQRELDAEREKREALEEKMILMERQMAVLVEGKRRPRAAEPTESEG